MTPYELARLLLLQFPLDLTQVLISILYSSDGTFGRFEVGFKYFQLGFSVYLQDT